MQLGVRQFDFRNPPHCIVIGEIGVNHNGSEALLFELIDKGIKAGLDVVKLQRFNSSLEISTHAELANYQKVEGEAGNQLTMAKALELSDDLLKKAKLYCDEKNVGFLCAAFEHESVDFLVDELGASVIKIPSPELNNYPLLEYAARRCSGLIISTGASYLNEVTQAIEWVRSANPTIDLALMHCCSEYPAPSSDLNLQAIATIAERTGLPTGYSDHSSGTTTATICAALGCVMIEKHYTLDKSLPGPDHVASASLEELTDLVSLVKEVKISLGDGEKRPMPSEAKNRGLIRKSIYCNVETLKKGTLITADMIEGHILACKRPVQENGFSPDQFNQLVGKELCSDIMYDTPLLPEHFT